MATKKDLFDADKKDGLLKEALKKAKQKSKTGEKFPCIFGMGKNGSMMVIDWKRQNDPGKLMLEMKKDHDKVIIGEASVAGDEISINIQDRKGGKIKPIDVKQCLRQLGAPIKKAKLVEGGQDVTDDE